MITYEDWIDKNEEIVLDELLEKLDELDLPNSVYVKLENKIHDELGDILEHRYDAEFSAWIDNQYDVMKDNNV